MKPLVLLTLILISLSSFASSVHSSFTCSDVKGCSPLVINLTDHSTGNVTNWHWDLGNGNTSTQKNPSATYLTPGIYNVKLTVSDGTHKDSSTHAITVYSPPTANFVSDRSTACPNDSIQFTNLATGGSAPINQYAWDFGNGIGSSTTNAPYHYPQSGVFNVTLVVQDTNGCNGHVTKTGFITVWPKPTSIFATSPILACAASQVVNFTDQSTGSGLTYNWEFGDSTNSSNANPAHHYSYGKFYATQIVTNSNGCIDSSKQFVQVIDLKANFMASKTIVCAGETVHFSDMSPMPGTVWNWNFGDGTQSSRTNPAKVYSHPGVYSVTFKVSDQICHDSATKVAYITVNQGFSIGFSADNQFSCSVPFPVHFTSHAPSGVSLTWNLGNGVFSDSINPSNVYTTSGAFAVTLTAVDSSGCTVVSTAPGFINTSKPYTKFISDSMFCPGIGVLFTNKTINGTRYLWNFGDGDTSTQYSPTHVYNNYGRYTVSLTAWDSIGCDSTYTRHSYINVDSTVVDFNVDEKFSMCPPLVSVFRSHTNRNDLTYQWDFGDGNTDTAANPTHVYFHPGVYNVKLFVTNKYGCSNRIVYNSLITVQGPSGIFTMTPNTGCVPVDVNFTATTSANTRSIICDLGDGTLYNDSANFSYIYNSVNIFHPKFILTDQVGCTVPYELDSIITHGQPVINFKDTSICAGSTVSVNAGSGHFHWNEHILPLCDTCVQNLTVCDTCNIVVVHPMDTTEYIATVSNDFGCSATGRFKVMVDPLPILSTQDTIKLCKNASITLDIVKHADNVSWAPATFLNSPTALQPTCTPTLDVDYVVTASNKLGCTVTRNIPVKVYDKMPLTLTNDTAVCGGTKVQLNASITDTFFHNVNYAWSGTGYLNHYNTADPIATVFSQGETFHVTATSGVCPAVTASVTLDVHPSASVKLPETIVTTPYTEVSIAPVSGDLVSYNWSAKDSLSCTECAVTTLSAIESQVVYVEGKNQYGCAAKDSMKIHILNCDPASIFVPNTFTPNNDGTNDKLYVRSRTLSQLEYFRLFNRWGAIVFETKNVSEGWDGNINGRVAEQGVYVYQISGKCENGYDVATSGTVTLIR